MKIGQGYDIHKLVEGRELIIGGVKIPYHKGLLAHSDGDVLIHAIIDAILGALGETDIGSFFPDDDPQYKDISSIYLLEKIQKLTAFKKYEIINVDSTVIAQVPKLAPYIDEMREVLSKALCINKTQLTVKAKTNEGMDSVGKEEAISAYAAVLLNQY